MSISETCRFPDERHRGSGDSQFARGMPRRSVEMMSILRRTGGIKSTCETLQFPTERQHGSESPSERGMSCRSWGSIKTICEISRRRVGKRRRIAAGPHGRSRSDCLRTLRKRGRSLRACRVAATCVEDGMHR